METAIATGIGIVASVLVTFAGSYWLFVLQRKRTELGFQVLSANVLIPGPPEETPDIKLLVRSKLIDPGISEEFSEVAEVLGFRVLLKNTGTEPLEKQSVTIDLEEPAVTLSANIERKPDFGEQSVEIQTQWGAPHRTRLLVPFLNPKEEVVLSLQSINNEGKTCAVSAGAPGLIYYDIGRRATRQLAVRMAGMVSLLVLSAAAVVTLSLLYGDDSAPSWAEPTRWAAFGTFFGTFLLFPVAMMTRGPR